MYELPQDRTGQERQVTNRQRAKTTQKLVKDNEQEGEDNQGVDTRQKSMGPSGGHGEIGKVQRTDLVEYC